MVQRWASSHDLPRSDRTLGPQVPVLAAITSVEFLSQIQEQLVREQFLSLVDLRTQVHFTYWSELHLVTRELCDQLPFGQIFSATSFYRLIDFQLGSLVTAAQRTLTLWALIGVRQYNGSLVDQLTLFHDETFLWHYSVPPKRQEILYQIHNGNRVRFLSRFFLSQTKIELEFSEIQLLSSGDQLVYTDSKEYTYSCRDSLLYFEQWATTKA